jgi:hypothetical protein
MKGFGIRHSAGTRAFRTILITLVVILVSGGVSYGGTITGPTVIVNDADTGIATGITYTHLLDFISDQSAANINGVQFTAAGRTGANYTSTNIPGQILESQFNGGGAGTGAAPGSGLHKLLTDFYYNANPIVAGQAETVTLRGLTPGVPHRLRMFYRQWDANEANIRSTELSFDEEDAGGPTVLTVNQDESEAARMLVYDYTAGPSGILTISFLEGGNTPPASWHQYGLSNEVVPEPSSACLLGAVAFAMLARRRRQGVAA